MSAADRHPDDLAARLRACENALADTTEERDMANAHIVDLRAERDACKARAIEALGAAEPAEPDSPQPVTPDEPDGRSWDDAKHPGRVISSQTVPVDLPVPIKPVTPDEARRVAIEGDGWERRDTLLAVADQLETVTAQRDAAEAVARRALDGWVPWFPETYWDKEDYDPHWSARRPPASDEPQKEEGYYNTAPMSKAEQITINDRIRGGQ